MLYLPQFCLLVFWNGCRNFLSCLFFPHSPTPSIMVQCMGFLTQWAVSKDQTKRTGLCCSRRLDSSSSWTKKLWKEMRNFPQEICWIYRCFHQWLVPVLTHMGLYELLLNGLYRPWTAQGNCDEASGLSQRCSVCDLLHRDPWVFEVTELLRCISATQGYNARSRSLPGTQPALRSESERGNREWTR